MFQVLIELAIFNFFAVMSPGPDFAIVVQNTLTYSRKAGMYTALGIATAVLIHTSYCLLGLAVILANSHKAMIIIGWIGGCYLIWLGIKAFRSSMSAADVFVQNNITSNQPQKLCHAWTGFKCGFLTNLLNAKAIIFLVAMFSAIVKGPISFGWGIAISLEIFLIVIGWFLLLAWFLSQKIFQQRLKRLMPYIIKIMGLILLFFGGTVIVESMLLYA